MGLFLGTSVSCMYFSLQSMVTIPMYIHYLTELILSSVENTVGLHQHITFFILYEASCRLVSHLKLTVPIICSNLAWYV